MNKTFLQPDTAYLIRKTYFYSGKIEWIKVLQSTQTAYKIQYEGGGCNWVTKEHFHGNYIVVEELIEPKPYINTFYENPELLK